MVDTKTQSKYSSKSEITELIKFEKMIDNVALILEKQKNGGNILLADSTFLSYLNIEEHLGKPKIERNRKRVYLSRNNFIDFTDEKAAEYVERYLTSIQANLRGMTKAEVLRTVKIPKTIKGVEAILQHNEELKMREKELQKEKLKHESEINQLVYELYGLTKEEIRIIERQ